MPFKDTKEGQTSHCTHLPQPQICDECLAKEPRVVLLSIQKERLIKIISELPDRFPEIASDEYDRGFRACKQEIIDIIR